MVKKVFTEEEKEWLKENFTKMSRADCARYLQVSGNTIRRTAIELGIYHEKTKPVKVTRNVVPEILISGEGYCQDCILYKVGGICGKNGRPTGALHKKNCFKKS